MDRLFGKWIEAFGWNFWTFTNILVFFSGPGNSAQQLLTPLDQDLEMSLTLSPPQVAFAA